jgi:porphobilinogen synthase
MFMYPVLISDNPDSGADVPSLPGQRRWGVIDSKAFLVQIQKGLQSVFILGAPTKDEKVGRLLSNVQV